MLVIDDQTIFCTDPEGWLGLRRVADLVMEDVRLVTGTRPECVDIHKATGKVVYFGTLGESKWLDMLNAREDFDFKEVRRKREVFGFWTVENLGHGIEEALIIVGSDRLGTIYGLFHLSEILGVSPLVRAFGVQPKLRPRVELGPWVNYAAAAPSAKLRGLSVPGPLSGEESWTILERLLRQRGNTLEVRMAEDCGKEAAEIPADVLTWAEECGMIINPDAEVKASSSEEFPEPALIRFGASTATHLPEMWSRMTDEFERNPEVSFLLKTDRDLMPEPGISFFLDLAYDKKKLGGRDASVTSRYSWEWLKRQFGAAFPAKELSRLDQMLKDYSKLEARWRPEELSAGIGASALHGPESVAVIRRESERCRQTLETLHSLSSVVELSAFESLVASPVRDAVTSIESALGCASGRVQPHCVTLLQGAAEAYMWTDALRPDVGSIPFEITGLEGQEFSFRIQSGCPWIRFSMTEGQSSTPVRVVAAIDRSAVSGRSEGVFVVSDASGNAVTVQILVYQPGPSDESDCFWDNAGVLSMDASHYSRAIFASDSGFEILAPFGPVGSAVKAFPVSADYTGKPLHSLPCVEYEFLAAEAGHRKIRFLLSSACDADRIGFSLGRGPVQVASETVFEDVCGIRALEASFDCPAGRNLLRVYALTPGTVLSRILIRKPDAPAPISCTGPEESYFHRSSDQN